MTRVATYGTWTSLLEAVDVVRAGVQLGAVAVGPDESLWWSEERPAEAGRSAVVRSCPDGTIGDVLPASCSARTRLHEYGGRAFLPLASGLAYVEEDDQRLYLLDDGQKPRPLTPAQPDGRDVHFAEPVLSPDGTELWCVRERHEDRVRHDIVAIPLDGAAGTDPGRVRVLVGGSDFVAAPRPSPDGRWLAWIAWNHPQMPWDGTELRVAEIGEDGTVGTARRLLGGPSESVLQPEWISSERMYLVSDRSGWWNIFTLTLDGTAPLPLLPREEEFGFPLWCAGFMTYSVLQDGRLAVLHGVGDLRLGLLDPRAGRLDDVPGPWTSWEPVLANGGTTVIGVAGSPSRPSSVVVVDTSSVGPPRVVRPGEATTRGLDCVAVPIHEEFVGRDGRNVHAVVHRPYSNEFVAPEGELPPFVIFVHGGPTDRRSTVFAERITYFTSRGLGVAEVEYGGSAGYGREYRERLRGQWGVVDVEDCVVVADALADRGEADPARIAIRGGSAGGWTVLRALTTTDAFAMGTSYYGVADLLLLVKETHDFESRYFEGLVGPLPSAHDLYVERAPVSNLDGLRAPVLLFQGLNDPVVPPAQALLFARAAARKGLPHACLTFEGEQHGFRYLETMALCLEAELNFYVHGRLPESTTYTGDRSTWSLNYES